MTPDGPVGHDNDEEATGTTAAGTAASTSTITSTAAAAAIVSGSGTSANSSNSTNTVADIVDAAAAAAPRPIPSPAHDPEAAALSTSTNSVLQNTALTDSTNPPTATSTAADTVTATATATVPTAAPSIASSSSSSSVAAATITTSTTDTEPVRQSPLSLQEKTDGPQRQEQEQRLQTQSDEQPHQAPQVNGRSRLPDAKPEAKRDAAESQSESDMSNHRAGHSASIHHLNHHNHNHHHHHSHSLSTGYPTSTSSGASPVYSSSAALPSTQYAVSYPTVTSATALTADPFRVSPVGSTQMPLPSMRTIDAISQQGQSPAVSSLPHHTMSMGMSMPLVAVSPSAQYYSGHSMALPSNYSLAQELAQYPIPPPNDPRLIAHRGPKKEIKRRTKTGCLTCRKRRIKCDETHPTCNNCRKSKRECLGYDPIFRQQTIGQSGNTIQPAPGSLPPSPQAPLATSAYPSPSLTQVTGARIGNSYSQPPILSGVYAPTPASTIPSPTSSTIPAASISYHSSPTVKAASTSDFSTVKLDGTYDYTASNLDRAIRQLPTPASVDTRHLNQKQGHLPEIHYPRVNKMKIREIIDLLGPPASPQPISHTEETFNEITKVYHEMYAPGLSAFFETNWYYFTENGKMSFPKDIKLIEDMATFLRILEGVKANDHSQIAVSGALETRIVWELACTAYQSPERTNPMRINLPSDSDATEARNRLQVVEALLCGEYLSNNLLSPPVSDSDHHRIRQFDFWYCLGEFVRKQDNPYSPINVKSREDTLSRMRHLLDGRENRDVLYSIAVVRELAPGFEPEYGNTIPQHLDESDPKNRLAVASKFILDESQVSGGTTNVVRRFSDVASRAYVNPGVNIGRRL